MLWIGVVWLVAFVDASQWRWNGKTAVVTTERSSTIGSHLAKVLGEKGMKVVLVGKIAEKLQTSNIQFRDCDLTKESDVEATFDWIKTNMGQIDVLVNAAENYTGKSVMDGDFEQWKNLFVLNVLGVSLVTREALKLIAEESDSHIININSVIGHLDISYCAGAMYAITKHALIGLTEQLRTDMMLRSTTIKVTSISPPIVTKDGFNLEDLSDALIYALGTRPDVEINEIILNGVKSATCPDEIEE